MAKQLFKSYPHLKQMDKYSKKVAQRLYRKYPQWFLHAQVGQFGGESYLEIEVARPVKPSDRDLIISTYLGRITIHFDWYHTHFGGWRDMTFDDEFADAIRFIDEIISEKIVVGIRINEGNVKGGTVYLAEDIDRIPNGSINYLRSWKGTYDSDPFISAVEASSTSSLDLPYPNLGIIGN